jgi:hypothetical protein
MIWKRKSGGPAKKRGGELARAGKHFFALNFFGPFLFQDKKWTKHIASMSLAN